MVEDVIKCESRQYFVAISLAQYVASAQKIQDSVALHAKAKIPQVRGGIWGYMTGEYQMTARAIWN